MNAPSVRSIEAAMLRDAAKTLRTEGGRMIMAYALTGDDDAPELRYVSAPSGAQVFDQWQIQGGNEVPSLAEIWPLLGWYEREIADRHAIRFTGHPEPFPLIQPLGRAESDDWRQLPDVEGEAVQFLPFGPVRAGVVESAEFTFFYIGEAILHYVPHLFLKHRGMEERFVGCDIETGAVLAERVSAVGSAAHALAYSQAIEAACRVTVPDRALYQRVIIVELERLYNHLHYLGHLADTTTLKVGHAEGVLLAERVKQINARVTGSRFLRGAIAPGGLRRILDTDRLSETLDALREPIRRYIARLDRSESYFDRLATTGPLPRAVAFDQGATGPIARASGLDRDLRRDHPYAAYADDNLNLTVAGHQDGDANARARVRIAEIDASITMIRRALAVLPDGPIRVPCPPVAQSEALGWAESPRGTLIYAVHFDAAGRLARVKIKSPSFSNWRVFPYTVHETNMMDYAINEASFGLTISGCAR
ncbi:NADH-quinone oxidoreductase subunit C [Acidiphilium sp. AL]|uniref:NADH-quinone oxidoreductase subunit C n=1 Tax=Acidiphilium iwatense TaxID=768198 RepID=A0ABS9DTQ1_9PROT|nr:MULTISPECIES: NADH-quinone oxidoreductase subunit C [Acidiphilium]MCF3946111.1 NADH-quinone oxidoreductase subunit C [Acidiphilium iwatense]MCU4160981.1 NADH-quinone oxidoreductase subunit C [Acidiphilium sp. AL]